ncbi:orotidine-5'-phosphate decarboxylase [Alkalicoccus chagannorensis]|uniref:orotidine-5'-phosphate decarboxylase n=1 Tax=Alkalicoccus chagannorensis TaxID=427072 RepID=UPI0004264899|nr:orotidine-5'-phosphate decarboxylase [Alkalicoccus chagannorensis]
MGRRDLIVALDAADRAEAEAVTALLPSENLYVKVGMELFYREGPDFIEELKGKGISVFLDLKLHDIPETVKRSMKQLARLDIDMTNVHALGGTRMMQAAVEGLEAGTPAGKKRPLLLAVTQLTSTTDQQVREEQHSAVSLPDSVNKLARLTQHAGLDGVVCSAQETASLKRSCGADFLSVTPGIRMAGDAPDDQRRVVTPAEAAAAGADAIVVGRGITRAADVSAAYEAYWKEWLS